MDFKELLQNLKSIRAAVMASQLRLSAAGKEHATIAETWLRMRQYGIWGWEKISRIERAIKNGGCRENHWRDVDQLVVLYGRCVY